MNIEEAIKKVRLSLITTGAYEALMTPTEKKEHNFEINMVITLLQRGQRFEQMYIEIGKHFKDHHINYISRSALNKIILKLFPQVL